MKTKSKIYILCVDDEASVLEAVERDLASIEDTFPLESASDTKEAREVIDRIFSQGNKLGLILCDHVMPGQNGVDFLIELNQDHETSGIRKVLLTGQAGLEATIDAINHAGLKHYVAKPWKAAELDAIVRTQLTEYILENCIDPTPYMKELDAVRLSEAIYRKGLVSDS